MVLMCVIKLVANTCILGLTGITWVQSCNFTAKFWTWTEIHND